MKQIKGGRGKEWAKVDLTKKPLKERNMLLQDQPDRFFMATSHVNLIIWASLNQSSRKGNFSPTR